MDEEKFGWIFILSYDKETFIFTLGVLNGGNAGPAASPVYLNSYRSVQTILMMLLNLSHRAVDMSIFIFCIFFQNLQN